MEVLSLLRLSLVIFHLVLRVYYQHIFYPLFSVVHIQPAVRHPAALAGPLSAVLVPG